MIEDTRLQHFYKRLHDDKVPVIEDKSKIALWIALQREIFVKKLCSVTSTREMDLFIKGHIACLDNIISVWITSTSEEGEQHEQV